jgi:hypothetical protein
MKRVFSYLLAAATLPLFNHFQQIEAYHNGTVTFSEHLYDQTIGITIAISVVILVGCALLFSRLKSKLRLRDVGSIGVGLFALPILWQSVHGSRFGGEPYPVAITSGLGGPRSSAFFFAAAAAFIVVELFLRARDGHPDSVRQDQSNMLQPNQSAHPTLANGQLG